MSLLTQASLVVTPNANKSGKLYSVIPSNGNGDFTVTRATTATRTNSSGLIETTASGMVRRDFSLGSCPNLLLEPQRTNLALRSEEFDNASWFKTNITITANTSISPSGIQNADNLNEGTALGVHRLEGSNIAVTAGSVNSFSLYVKKETMRYFRIVINDASDTARWICAQFDLDTQTFTTGSGATAGSVITSASIQSVGNGWFRINIVGSLAVTTSIRPYMFGSDGVAISSIDTRGGAIYTGTNKTILLWGAQLEAGAYATSYIPTTSASVTRNADQISLGNVYTNGLITASGGTWFLEIRNNLARVRDAGSYSLLLGDSTVALPNAFTIRSATAGVSSRLIIAKIVATVETNLYTTLTDTVKIAIKWNGTTADVFVNGTKVVSSTAYTPTTMQFIYANGNDIPKTINQMALFPTPLTDTQCTQLTTL
jgi:hypothetical protein